MAQGDRSVRRGRRAVAHAGAVPGRSLRGSRDDEWSGCGCREMRLCRPRQWGACWLAGVLWRELQLDRFWAERLPRSRKGTRWDHVLQVLATYRLIAPGSEWRLHRQWFLDSAMADLLGADFGLAEAHKLYACHDLLLAHKQALFSHLTERWRDLFNASFDVLLYDLTSTYFEVNASDLPEGSKRRHGYSRDKRPDCPQLVIALVVTPEGLPLAYEVLPGNTADSKTLRAFLAKIESQYGKARRVWVMDRGVPTEEVLAEMRASDPPVQLSGGNAEGPPHPARKAARRQAVAKGARGRRGQTAGAGRRTLCLRPERRSRQQRARDAAATTQMAVGAIEEARRDGRLARGKADEARRRALQGALRLASGRGRSRRRDRRADLFARSRKTAERSGAAKGAICCAPI